MPITTAGWSAAGGIVERHGGPVAHSWPDIAFPRAAPVRRATSGSTGWVFHSGWFQVELTHPAGGPVRIEDLRLHEKSLMPPVALTAVRVYYRLDDAALTPQSARVTLEPAVPVNAPTADLGITTRRVTLELNAATGFLETWVVRSNDPALSGLMPYRLTVDALEHHRTSVIEIVGETDLADVAPVSEPVSVNPVYLLAAALGVTVAPLVDGLVPAVHLPPASSGTTTQVQLAAIAAVALSGQRAVTPRPDGTLEYASNAVAAHLHAPLWVTRGAVIAGDLVTVLAYGALTESSWAWTPGVPLFLGTNGLLTQTSPVAPAALFSAQVGTATGPTSAFVDRQSSISLV